MTQLTFLKVKGSFGEPYKSSAAADPYHFVVGNCKTPLSAGVTLGLNWARQGNHKKDLRVAVLLKAQGLARERC